MATIITKMNHLLDEMIRMKWLAVAVVFYFYGMMLKKEIALSSGELGVAFNNWDISLRLLNDMYLIVYFIIPFVLFLSSRTVLKDFDYQLLIRLGSYRRWVYHSLASFWAKASPLFTLWIFLSLFMAIGFPFSWHWSSLSGTSYATNTLNGLAAVFEFPFLALAVQVFLIAFAFSLMHMALGIFYVLVQHKAFMYLVSAVIFLVSVIGFKVLPNHLAFLVPPTYFSLTKAVELFQSLWLLGLSLSIIGGLYYLCIRFLDVNKRRYLSSFSLYFPVVGYVTLCILGIIAVGNSLKESDQASIWDVWAMAFTGVSTEYFSYLPFFYYIIVFFGFVYGVQVFLSREVEQLGYYKIIRFQNLGAWMWSWMRRLLVAIFLFLIGLMALALMIGALLGRETDFQVLMFPNPLTEIIYHFFFNGFLQVALYINIVFIVSWVSKESIHGMVLISIFMVLMLPGFNVAGLVPVGLNGMAYLVEYSPYYLSLVLLGFNLFAVSMIHVLFKRSLKI
ncbi:hypothetical protein [Thalassobacillus devorans]|uniref:hypothetical protein n=1 Tax=Thalassobacillus devorans TaxID=279813 RepID=UPI000A1CC982|nr:hypothetical protein [Thalassobacillus devorans]